MTKSLYIIHIGKCGGGSFKKELVKNKINFSGCHCKKPNINNKYKYIILIRDPINRFVSAFNWKKYRTCELKMKDVTRKNEVDGFIYWNDINNLAENIYNENGKINDKALSFIKKDCNHLEFDINYYLEDALNILNKLNCNIIRYEYYKEDIKMLFNIDITEHIHTYEKPYIKLSVKALHNLNIFLKNDYKCFEELKNKGILSNKYYQDILACKFYLSSTK